MNSHRAVATLAFGVLGLTFFPILGSVVAVVLGRGGQQSGQAGDTETERYRRIGLWLGYAGLALAALLFVAGLLAGLLSAR
jgi:hypothetical protein